MASGVKKQMLADITKCKNKTWFKIGRRIRVNNKMQPRSMGYSYTLEARPGEITDKNFNPELEPKQMLEMGIIEGKYINDAVSEYPKYWFSKKAQARMGAEKPDPSLNWSGVKSRMSLREWRRRGWIIGDDPRGWIEWYFRYWLGRRDPEIDKVQISRHNSFVRHRAQVVKNCRKGNLECRKKQKQALLQWAYDPTKL